PAEEGALGADRRVLRARAGAPGWRWPGARIELPVDDHQPPAGPEHASPLVDRGLGRSQGPEHMAADHEVEGRGREREVLGVAFLESDRDCAPGRLAPRLGYHRGREVDAGHAVPAPEELEAQEAGAAADVEGAGRPHAGASAREGAGPSG